MRLRVTLPLCLLVLTVSTVTAQPPATSAVPAATPTPIVPSLTPAETPAVERVRLLYTVINLEFENARLRYETALKNLQAEQERVTATLTKHDGYTFDWQTGQYIVTPPVTPATP